MLALSVRNGLRVALLLTLARGVRGAQGDVSFLTCTPTAEGALTYRCQIAASCRASPCDPAQWTPIAGEPSLPAGFFEPGGTRGSAIQVTPVAIEGSVYTLVNKDVGAERWAIIRDDSTGIVTGNVSPAAPAARPVHLRRPDQEARGVATTASRPRPAASMAALTDWAIGGTAPSRRRFPPTKAAVLVSRGDADGEQILISKDPRAAG
jgi:hypothetical protein